MIEESDISLDIPKKKHEKSPSIHPHDLSARDVERAKFAFSVYDFEANDTIDAFYLGDCLRALNLNPTNHEIEKYGGKTMKKQKFLKVEEFLPIFAKVKESKNCGCREDFEECLALYDKHLDGKLLFAELQHILLALGEPLSQAEVDTICKECCEEEDEDGFIRYAPFLDKLLNPPEEQSSA